MKKEVFYFKPWTFAMNTVLFIAFFGVAIVLLPSVLQDLSSLEQLSDIYLPLFFLALLWLTFCDFGYNLLLFLPKGIALELHDNQIRVCSPFGIKTIPKQEVKGCKNPVHRATGGPKSGMVVISVSAKHKVIGSYGMKANPSFHGPSITNENESSIVKKIRAWRRNQTSVTY